MIKNDVTLLVRQIDDLKADNKALQKRVKVLENEVQVCRGREPKKVWLQKHH